MRIAVRPVTLETRAEFAAILEEANSWQKARGSQGWSGAFDDAWMLPRITRGELFLAWLDDHAVAAFRLVLEDRLFWGDKDIGDSIYLHSFAVRRDKAGRGIGEAVIECVMAMGRDRGLAKLRLDCFLANAGLVAFYERNGFRSVGTTTVRGQRLNLMEKAIGPLSAS